MKKALYINNDKVRILQDDNRGKSKKAFSFDLEPGSVINGVIIKNQEIKKIFLENSKLLKGATVVLNSSNIQIRKLEHPDLKGEKLNSYIRNEFAIPEDGSIIYGYNSQKTGKQTSTLYMSVPREIMDSYYDIFKETGIEPGRFEVLQNGMSKFVRSKKDLSKGTFVLNLLEGGNLISVLIEAGEYVLTERSRLLSEPGTDDFLEELLQKLSSMIQFNISRKSPHELKSSYYVGLPTPELKVLKEKNKVLNNGIDILGFIDEYFKDESALTHFSCHMGILEMKKDLELKKYYQRQIRKKTAGKTKAVVAVGLTLLFCLGLFGVLKTLNIRIENNIALLESSIAQKNMKEELKELVQKQKIINDVPVIESEVDFKNISGTDRRVLSSTKLLTIFQKAGDDIDITSIEGDAGQKTIAIEARGKSEFSSSDYVAELEKTGLFLKVDYTGYTSNSEDEYTFRIVCILK